MIVLLAWAAAAVVALLVGVLLAFELAGHLRRLRREMRSAETDLSTALRELKTRVQSRP